MAILGELGLNGGFGLSKPNESLYSVGVTVREISLAVLALFDMVTLMTPADSSPAKSSSEKPNTISVQRLIRQSQV